MGITEYDESSKDEFGERIEVLLKSSDLSDYQKHFLKLAVENFTIICARNNKNFISNYGLCENAISNVENWNNEEMAPTVQIPTMDEIKALFNNAIGWPRDIQLLI